MCCVAVQYLRESGDRDVASQGAEVERGVDGGLEGLGHDGELGLVGGGVGRAPRRQRASAAAQVLVVIRWRHDLSVNRQMRHEIINMHVCGAEEINREYRAL